MANCQIFRLPEVETSTANLRHSLSVVLHTICLCRALGPVAPRPVFSTDDRYKIGFAKCGAQEVDDAVDRAIQKFATEPKRQVAPELERGEVVVSFYRLMMNTSIFGLSSVEEHVYWERWIVPFLVSARTVDERAEQATITDVVLRIATLVNEKSDHLPPPPTRTSMYPFEITVGSESGNDAVPASRPASDIASSLTNLGGRVMSATNTGGLFGFSGVGGS